MTKGETKVTIPYPERCSPTNVANIIIYMQCKRRDHGLTPEKVEVLSIIFSQAKDKGISASAISSYFTGGRPGKTALFYTTQQKLTWLTAKGWITYEKISKAYFYKPSKKTIEFFKVEKPASIPAA